MEGKAGDHPGFAYSESHSEGNCTGSFMIREGDWKYIHFTWYDDLLLNVSEDPGEFKNLIDEPAAAKIRDELRDILHRQVNPEEITLRAFDAQERVLQSIADRLTEDELFEVFKGRLGHGLARVMAAKCKRRIC
jgi:arylsulfatase A-like enzyme